MTSVATRNRRSGFAIPAWSMPLLFVVGATSQYIGAAIGVFLFETIEPTTVAWLRAAAGGLALVLWRRPWRRAWTRREVLVATAFGIVTVVMNIVFYEAIARIPLGTAVAIEFLGPVAVAAFGSRRARDIFAVVLVAAGVFLLAGVQLDVSPIGVGFAVAAAVMWAGYILVGKRVADAGQGLDSLAVGMAVAAGVLAPFVVVPQLAVDATVFADPRTWLLGVGVGVMASAVPYALDQVVLRRVGRARFAVLLALLPATAAVVGAIFLTQRPQLVEILGITLVVIAVAATAAQPREDPPTTPV
ncbi:EamA family transporter [Nocardia sp. NPDC052566]|uniref:EamA family transporter n=1 Tax=Nocardia sp. NPDC052566 TaxID=3364330 RepID=UPI0037C99F11